jgi:hypothetical protein
MRTQTSLALLIGVALLGGGALYGVAARGGKDAAAASRDTCVVGTDPVGAFRCRNTWISYLKTSYR